MIRAVALTLLLATAPAWAAVTPSEQLADSAQEARARALGQELRCLVCQNQSIDDSDADLARDLRRIVRERIVAGDADQQILDYLTDRYGAFVLLRPPVERSTWALWFGPPALLAVAAVTALVWRRRQGEGTGQGWSDAEQRLLDDALAHDQGEGATAGLGGGHRAEDR
jgi:cytochrome c-type biogenesis protein CcmH